MQKQSFGSSAVSPGSLQVPDLGSVEFYFEDLQVYQVPHFRTPPMPRLLAQACWQPCFPTFGVPQGRHPKNGKTMKKIDEQSCGCNQQKWLELG